MRANMAAIVAAIVEALGWLALALAATLWLVAALVAAAFAGLWTLAAGRALRRRRK